MRRRYSINRNELLIKVIIFLIVAAIFGVSIIFSAKIENLLGLNKTATSGNYSEVEVVKNNDLVLHYIDVGQADCTFIELPDKTTMLIDAGDTGTKAKVSEYISSLGYNTINYFVVTHSDQDHVGGASQILDDFYVQNIYRPFAFAGSFKIDTETGKPKEGNITTFECNNTYEDLYSVYNSLSGTDDNIRSLPRIATKAYTSFIEKSYSEKYDNNTKEASVTVNYDGLEINSTKESDGVYFSIKWYAPLKVGNVNLSSYTTKTKGFITKGYDTPGAKSTATGKNAISPVIKIEYDSNKFLFTGDIYDTAEEEVVDSLTTSEKQELSNIDVYQAGHHGAKNSNTQKLLNIIQPTYTVVSCGDKNEYGHPSDEFLERLASLTHTVTDYLLVTHNQGTIMFGVSKGGNIVYAANVLVNQNVFVIRWWHIAGGIIVVSAVLIFGIRLPKQSKKRK